MAVKLLRTPVACPPPSLLKNSLEPRSNEKAGMRPTRHFGQLGLDTDAWCGTINNGCRDITLSEKAVRRFLGT